MIYETLLYRQRGLPLIPACICTYPDIHLWQWMYLPEGLFLGSLFEMRGEWLLSDGYSCVFLCGRISASCMMQAAYDVLYLPAFIFFLSKACGSVNIIVYVGLSAYITILVQRYPSSEALLLQCLALYGYLLLDPSHGVLNLLGCALSSP